MYRVGHGYDSHRFEEGKPLILGGVTIPFPQGMKGHSDGDVILHAICDAILGAAALGDMGRHFPDTDEQFANKDSRFFIRTVKDMIQHSDLQIMNVDASVLAESPRLSPFIEQMRKTIATDLDLAINRVNVKATTNEKMGFIGRQEGIACHAVVLLEVTT